MFSSSFNGHVNAIQHGSAGKHGSGAKLNNKDRYPSIINLAAAPFQLLYAADPRSSTGLDESELSRKNKTLLFVYYDEKKN